MVKRGRLLQSNDLIAGKREKGSEGSNFANNIHPVVKSTYTQTQGCYHLRKDKDGVKATVLYRR